MKLLYKINLTDAQRESLTETEATFVNLFNQFRWAFVPGKVEDHPINIFRNFENPKGHNLIEEMIHIKKHLTGLLTKRPGSVWRGLDWSKSFQNWLIRTEPRIKPESLKEDIVPGQPEKVQKTPYEDKIEIYLEQCMTYECTITQADVKKFAGYLATLKEGFDPVAVGGKSNHALLWHLYYASDSVKMNYYEELLRLRIQEITDNDPEIRKFIFWCYSIIEDATQRGQIVLDLITYFFAEYITGKVVVDKNYTKKPLKKEAITKQKETAEPVEESEYVKIQFDTEKIYTLRDIRGLIK